VRQTRRFEAEDAKDRVMSLLIARLILYSSCSIDAFYREMIP
jgi:hypothetical protein